MQIKKNEKLAKVELEERELSYILDSFRMLNAAHGMQKIFSRALKKSNQEAPEEKDIDSVKELHAEVTKKFEDALIRLKSV